MAEEMKVPENSAEEQLCTRLAASHIDENSNVGVEESSNVIVDMLLAPGRFVGGWMSWLVTGDNNPPADSSSADSAECLAGNTSERKNDSFEDDTSERNNYSFAEENTNERNNDLFACSDDDVMAKIFLHLDDGSLESCEHVYEKWYEFIDEKMLWKNLIERKVTTDSLWRGLAERRGWIKYLSESHSDEKHPENSFYCNLFSEMINDIKTLNNNWQNRIFNLRQINCESKNKKGVYCMQYNDKIIVAGLRDGTIKIWDRNTLKCIKTLIGHTSSVLCLQFDEEIIISGSSDSTVKVWDIVTGQCDNTLIHHDDGVLRLKFSNGILVTCSKDRSIAVWEMKSPRSIQLRRVMEGHKAAVNCIDFDEKYIVSGCGDRTIKIWNAKTCEFVRTINSHKRGIICLQYSYPLIINGSSDNTIKIWDVDTGECIRMLTGHEDVVRCISFDNKYIVSGDYKGNIKVWDLPGALDPERNFQSLCLQTFKKHTNRVYSLQFDEFQIVSSSHDGTIKIWNFLTGKREEPVDNATIDQVDTKSLSSSDDEDNSFVMV